MRNLRNRHDLLIRGGDCHPPAAFTGLPDQQIIPGGREHHLYGRERLRLRNGSRVKNRTGLVTQNTPVSATLTHSRCGLVTVFDWVPDKVGSGTKAYARPNFPLRVFNKGRCAIAMVTSAQGMQVEREAIHRVMTADLRTLLPWVLLLAMSSSGALRRKPCLRLISILRLITTLQARPPMARRPGHPRVFAISKPAANHAAPGASPAAANFSGPLSPPPNCGRWLRNSQPCARPRPTLE